MSLVTDLIENKTPCPVCGRIHEAKVEKVIVEAGALKRIPEILAEYGAKKPFVLMDENTKAAAGAQVLRILEENGIEFVSYCFGAERLEPDEKTVGSAALHFDNTCDFLVTVGSGVLNDTGKVIAGIGRLPYLIVGTAPSMDGYASASSSVIRDGLKYSAATKCPEIVLGDLDVLQKAPKRMIVSGIGDMIAKYVSLAEWKISHIINGEYYCPAIAETVETGLKQCVDAVGKGLTSSEAIASVMEGMVLAGVSMNAAGCSRPASGMEHYLSHIWDMRSVDPGRPCDFHGIQVAVGTLWSLKAYEMLKTVVPDREKALRYAAAFDKTAWRESLRKWTGRGAEAMIAGEEKEGKYDREKHAARLEIILEKWNEILDVIRGLPSADWLESFLKSLGAPTSVTEFGLTREEEKAAFIHSEDIRDKYVGTRLLRDLGLLDEFADRLFG